jgi:hypothetical protein
MAISAELEAKIMRYHYVEKWRVGTIARQLKGCKITYLPWIQDPCQDAFSSHRYLRMKHRILRHQLKYKVYQLNS